MYMDRFKEAQKLYNQMTVLDKVLESLDHYETMAIIYFRYGNSTIDIDIENTGIGTEILEDFKAAVKKRRAAIFSQFAEL